MTVNYNLGKKNYCITKYVTLFNTRRLVYEIHVSKLSSVMVSALTPEDFKLLHLKQSTITNFFSS